MLLVFNVSRCFIGAIDHQKLTPVLEKAAAEVLAAAEAQTHEFSPRQMRYAHQFLEVLLPVWRKELG